MRKICVVTGSRAEYGLLYWIMKELARAPDVELQVIATGMHLSPEFGLTFREVEKDFSIAKKIEILMSSDTSVGISKSMGLAQISFGEAYAELSPDIVLVLGDRFEIFSAAAAAMVACIPLAHIHGGETTEGAFDEAIRHSITKMSHLHFAATEEYRRRIIQLGESPDHVFNFGAPGLDNVFNLELLTKDALEKELGISLAGKNLLVTFHPATLDKGRASDQFEQLLMALDELEDVHIIFTKANADAEGRHINALIDQYVSARKGKSVAFASMGQLRYLSALQYVDAVVGNSSSGLIEAPAFKIGTINIGERQKGRIKANSVIDCEPSREGIVNALRTVYSEDFRRQLRHTANPYGLGGASKKIAEKLRVTPLGGILKKRFNDVDGMSLV